MCWVIFYLALIIIQANDSVSDRREFVIFFTVDVHYLNVIDLPCRTTPISAKHIGLFVAFSSSLSTTTSICMHFKFQSIQIRYARFWCFNIRCVNFAWIISWSIKIKATVRARILGYIIYNGLTPRPDPYLVIVIFQLIWYNTSKAFFIIKKKATPVLY